MTGSRPRRDRRGSGTDQPGLFPDPRVRRGRTERAADTYLRQRRDAGTTVDPAAAAAFRGAARDRDQAALEHDVWKGAAASKEMREWYLVIVAGEASHDGFADELAALLAPAVGDGPPS